MLITSISGIRGTIGGVPGENLTPLDVAEFAAAYGSWVKKKHTQPVIIIGRDARKSGSMILDIVAQTLCGMGIDIINLGTATTPTVEMMVLKHTAQGAIIITASHNPKEYNGLKMLNQFGEFLSAQDGQEILEIAHTKDFSFAEVDGLGNQQKYYNHHQDHINAILDLDIIDVDLIRSKKYRIALDAINSVGGIAVPMLLEKLGVEVVGLYCEANGEFQHMPEPLEKNLSTLKSLVQKTQSDLGIAVDPDVDRLVLVDEQGAMFGEEYTIIACSDLVLDHTPGACVSNLSSSRALRDLAEEKKVEYHTSAVGEKNVVEKMKQVSAVIGGEGSGGVIYPALHYGRDALVGIALFLQLIASRDISVSTLRERYGNYYMAKEKLALEKREDILPILEALRSGYKNESINDIDGLKIDFSDSWVHIRASNTEPILRIYTEAKTPEAANDLAQKIILDINQK